MAKKKRTSRAAPTPELEATPADDAQGDDDSQQEVLEQQGPQDDADDVWEVMNGALEPAESVEPEAALPTEFALAPLGQAKTTSLARLDPLQTYMREVQRHPLLTREEEHELAVSYAATGDVKAAARLVTANLRLVVKLAYEYRRAYRNMMDLIQEGNIGLMQAVKRYDPYRGVKLSSYSAWWIRAYMLRFILNNWRLVKLGTTQAQRKLFFNLSREKAKLSSMGIEPTDAEIARRLEVDEKDVREMDRRLARSDASLDVPIGDADGKQTTRLELLPATARGPEQLTESAELSDLVRQGLEEFRKTLTDKDLKIFDRRMIADEPLTLQELGHEFGVSRERVRQLEARITGRLREYLKQTLGDAVAVDG